MKKYGYIRVSSKDQNPDRQYAALKELSVKKVIFFWMSCPGRILKDPHI